MKNVYKVATARMHTTDAVEKAILEEDGYLLSYKDSNAVAISVCARLDRLAAPSKTPEERVKVEAGAGGYFSVYKIDGRIATDEEVLAGLRAALGATDGTHL
jgi:hypothetical protein